MFTLGSLGNRPLTAKIRSLVFWRLSRSALSDICKHSPELAQTVVDAGTGAERSEVMERYDRTL